MSSPNIRILLLVAIIGSAAMAGTEPTIPTPGRPDRIIRGGPAVQAKAVGDTINLMAAHHDPTNGPGEPHYYGDFQTGTGSPAWNGWTHWDDTRPDPNHHWQVSNFNQADTTNLAAWCGSLEFESCEPGVDPEGGYGNEWHEWLRYSRTVPYPAYTSFVTVTGIIQVDVESSDDEVALGFIDGDGIFNPIRSWDGKSTVNLDVSVSIREQEYRLGSDVSLAFRLLSDRSGSDEDCRWASAGGLQVDDLDVWISNGPSTLRDFTDFQDSTFGPWEPVVPPGVGDFAKIWSGLSDQDPCGHNPSPQVAFIDDGQVVPGTGGSTCLNWCYGPGGFITTTTGGLLGPEFHLENTIASPVMAWPGPEYDRLILEYDVYHHEDLTDDAPGIFTVWGVRSADTDGSAGWGIQVIEDQPWLGDKTVYSGIVGYERRLHEVSQYLNAEFDQVQISLGVLELGWIWGWDGDDGYPAPYFDNVTLKAFQTASGPVISALERYLAQDGFPESWTLDTENLASLHVRFDPAGATRVDPDKDGDQLIMDAIPFNPSIPVDYPPHLVYKVQANPLFDPYRSSGHPLEGSSPGRWFYIQDPYPPSEYAFDLPDSGFLFPGDVVHYYLTATDTYDGTDYTSTLPADTTGFGDEFAHPQDYHPFFTFRALPSLRDDGQGGVTQPRILFWDESADFSGLRSYKNSPVDERDRTPGIHKWFQALENMGLVVGHDYDIYSTNDPDYGDSNSLGGRATLEQISGYRTILYTSGPQHAHTLGNPVAEGSQADDLGLLRAWLELGNRNLLLTGDHLAQDLATNQGQEGFAFVTEIMGIYFESEDIRPLLNGQESPRVQVHDDQSVLTGPSSWLAYTGCPDPVTFDAVLPLGTSVTLAEFLDPGGQPGIYPYAAAILNQPFSAPTSRVIYLPYDLRNIMTDPNDKAAAPLSSRSLVLRDVLVFFGEPLQNEPSPAIPGPMFSVRNHPNPFNPVTKIVYTVPKTGHLSLKVFDIRGRLVKTLVDDRVEAGADQTLTWDGRNNAGAAVSSGVYFYEARTGGEVKVGKMALVK